MKQTVPISFRATVKLIDELSRGVCSLSHSERVRVEALAFFSMEEFGSIVEVGCPVWTKVPYIIKSFVPVSPALGEEQYAIQRAFTDHLWSMSLEEMLQHVDEDFFRNYPRLPDFASLMNADYDERKETLRSYEQVFMSELYWEVERHLPQFELAFAEIHYRKTGAFPVQTTDEAQEVRHLLRNTVCNIFDLKKSGSYFPSLFVSSSLSAAVWWDRNRKFKQNDVQDFGHAQVAIPYCDFFLTEKNLKSISRAGHVGFSDRFSCRVLSEPEEILLELSRIL